MRVKASLILLFHFTELNTVSASCEEIFDIFFEKSSFTRVESPYQLQKSVPDNYKFVSNSSMNVNKSWFNQQFEMFQSQQYDDEFCCQTN